MLQGAFHECYMALFMENIHVLGRGDGSHGQSVFWQTPSLCAAYHRVLFMDIIGLFWCMSQCYMALSMENMYALGGGEGNHRGGLF